MKLCLTLDNQRDLPGHRAAMLLLVSLSEVELLLINAHFSYVCALLNFGGDLGNQRRPTLESVTESFSTLKRL